MYMKNRKKNPNNLEVLLYTFSEIMQKSKTVVYCENVLLLKLHPVLLATFHDKLSYTSS